MTSAPTTRHGRAHALGALLVAALAGGVLLLASPAALAGTADGKGGFLTPSRSVRPPMVVAQPRVTRLSPPFLRTPSLLPSRVPAPTTTTPPQPLPAPQPDPEIAEPTGTGHVSVLATCSGSACLGGATVEIRVAGDVVATGRAGQSLEVPAGAPFDAWVSLPGLADAPLVQRSVQSPLEPDGNRTLTVDVETGRLAVQAYRNGRRVSAIVYLHRYPETSRIPSARPSGTMSANGQTREVTAERYLLRVLGSGQTVEQVITIPAGARRVVTVDLSR